MIPPLKFSCLIKRGIAGVGQIPRFINFLPVSFIPSVIALSRIFPLILVSLPIIIGGQKGLVEESDLRIPNMRGIMQARQKPLDTIEPFDFSPNTSTIKFHKPEPKQAVKLVDSDNLDELINLLHNEAKVL